MARSASGINEGHGRMNAVTTAREEREESASISLCLRLAKNACADSDDSIGGKNGRPCVPCGHDNCLFRCDALCINKGAFAFARRFIAICRVNQIRRDANTLQQLKPPWGS